MVCNFDGVEHTNEKTVCSAHVHVWNTIHASVLVLYTWLSSTIFNLESKEPVLDSLWALQAQNRLGARLQRSAVLVNSIH